MADTSGAQGGGEVFSNEFGSVFPERIAFYAKKSWFGGGVLEEYPVRHITSIRIETTRSTVLGAILVLAGLAILGSGSGGGIIAGLIIGGIGVLLLIGWPAVTIVTAGGELRKSSGNITQREAADAFAAAVRKVLFAKT